MLMTEGGGPVFDGSVSGGSGFGGFAPDGSGFAGTGLAASAPGVVDSAVRQALRRQAAELSVLAARFERARIAYEPRERGAGWRGGAQRAYSSAVQRLRTELDLAEGAIAGALREGLRAVEALGDREF